jgi:hypothetical protein
MPAPRVFLDTSCVKHSIRAVPRTRRISFGMQRFGNQPFEAFTTEFYDEDPATRANEPLRTEIENLRPIAQLAKEGKIELLWQVESQVEFWGTLLFPGGGHPELLQAPFTMVRGPIEYSRVLSPISPLSGETWRDVQLNFLRRLDHERFKQLQRACGAYQGKTIKDSQLIDAFHIWSAEECGATHFLTTDLKLDVVPTVVEI